MGQMIPINLPADGNWPTIVGDSIMIIGPRQNELTEEQRYFNPIYLMTYPGKEHLKAQMIRAGACDCDPTIPNRRIGVFSVAPDKKVSFSQGNLQYLPAINLWKFADTQYEYLGNANKYLKPTFRNWVDLFGWSANNTTAPFGVSTSMSAADYAGDFVDWGTNAICGDAPNTWRTLSVDEWGFLFQGRKNADQLLALATLEGVQGLVLLPDNWQQPEDIPFVSSVEQGLAWDATRLEGSYFDATNKDHTKDNIYTQAQWQKMEALGAVFLPCAGWRQEKTWTHAGIVEVNIKYLGSYWSCSTPQISNDYYLFRFTQQEIRKFPLNNSLSLLARGRSVRLVHDTIVSTPEPEYVDLGLSVKWATFNVGATSPEDYGDYFAWGETEPKETYSWATYKWCDGTQNTMTKYNATDGKTILEPEDDAAHVHWGDKWRMPTKEEIQELFTRCTWKTETQNGINGYNVIGPNGNSIFVPTAGWYNEDLFGEGVQGNSTYYWTSTLSSANKIHAYDLVFNDVSGSNDGIIANTRRCGFPIRPVYDDRPTLTVIPTPEDAKVSFLCKGYQAVGHSITVDKGKDVLYQVTNVDAGYLSQGDSIYNLTKDSVLYVTLRPFSDGNWVKVDKSEYTKQEGYYVSRNNGGFASHSVWNYYVLPVLPGETYRVRGIAGQHAALWMAASTAPDAATNTRPTKISCCANRGVAAYVADEVTIPDGAKYLIINSRNGKEMMVERKVPDPCLVVKVNDTLSINMMCVEGGTFMMGAMEGDKQAHANEKPAHQVTLTYDYYIGQTEVTQALWQAVMGNNPSTMIGDNLPVNNVLWEEADAFVKRLSQMTGYTFHLPTEAEWEFAARGGNKSQGYLYAGSNNIQEVAWYGSNSGNTTQPVGTKQPNELGIYDMSGNVIEWCSDWLGPYSAEAQVNPIGPDTGAYHVYCGGCWYLPANVCRCTHRRQTTAGYGEAAVGLRVALREKIEPEYVDLGLSVKWATFNVGATSSNEIGSFYAWGEIEPKDTYTVKNYKWWNESSKEITKYCTIDSLAYGDVADGLTELQPQDDIAHILKGEHWRMPNLDECKELGNGCTWTVSTRQGQIGFEGISKINGNTIFLPVVGFRAGVNLVHETLGGYWSSTLNIEKQSCAMGLYLNLETPSVGIYYNSSRQNGFLIRPVYDEVPAP